MIAPLLASDFSGLAYAMLAVYAAAAGIAGLLTAGVVASLMKELRWLLWTPVFALLWALAAWAAVYFGMVKV